MENFSIRRAVRGDEGVVLTLLRDLADYEKLLDKFHITAEVIARDYFGAQPLLNCDLAFEGDKPVGCATWYWTYHSFAARRGIFLEDLFVRPQFRRHGLARALLSTLAKECVDNGYTRLAWAVLDWNVNAIALYDAVGGKQQNEWITYRVSGPELSALAGS